MATFTTGQRVRVVHHFLGNVPFNPAYVGCEATILFVNPDVPYPYHARVDGHGEADFAGGELAPLEPPAEQAEEWATRKVREVTRPTYTEPAREPVRVQ